jgi:hypothetical protein
MGKEKNTASASDAAKKKRGGWTKSSVSKRSLAPLRRDGLLPPEDSNKVRIPGNEVVPRPRVGERVMFIDYVNRGLSLPIHPFLRGLQYTYRLQLHHMAPNSIMHIACFITLCECYLGIFPHWGLWKHLFFLKRHRHGGEVYAVGGVVIQSRGDI